MMMAVHSSSSAKAAVRHSQTRVFEKLHEARSPVRCASRTPHRREVGALRSGGSTRGLVFAGLRSSRPRTECSKPVRAHDAREPRYRKNSYPKNSWRKNSGGRTSSERTAAGSANSSEESGENLARRDGRVAGFFPQRSPATFPQRSVAQSGTAGVFACQGQFVVVLGSLV